MFKKLIKRVSSLNESINNEEISFLKDNLDLSKNTELQEYINYVFEKLEQEKISRQLLESITESLDLDQILKTTTDEIGKLLKADRCLISLYDPEISEFRLENEYIKNKEIPSIFISQEITGLANRWPDELINKKSSLIINSSDFYSLNRSQKEYFMINGIKSLIVIPLVYKEELFGSIILHQIEAIKEWTFGHIEFLKDVANQIAIAINQAKLYQHMKKLAEREALLRKITETIRNSLDVNCTKNSIVKEVGRAFNADRCIIRLFDPINNVFLPIEEHTKYVSCPEANVEFVLGEKIDKYVEEKYKKNQCFISPDVEAVSRSQGFPAIVATKLFNDFNTKSSYCFPIFNQDKLLGGFIIHYTKQKVELSNEDIELLKELTNQTGIALYQAKLYTFTKKQVERESLLRNVSDAIRSSLDFDKIKYRFVKEIGRAFNTDRCFLRFYNEEGDYLPVDTEYLASSKFKNVKGTTFIKEGLDAEVKRIQLQNKPVIMIDNQVFSDKASINNNLKQLHKDLGIKSIYEIPIFHNKKLLGAFILHWADRVILNDEELALLKLIADQTGLALNQSELYKNVKNQAEKEKVLREIVNSIRSSLDILKTLEATCKEVAKLFNVGRVLILRYPERNSFEGWELLYEHKNINTLKGIEDFEQRKKVTEYWGKLLLEHKSGIVINNVFEFDMPEFMVEYFKFIGAKSHLVVPIKDNQGNIWGLIGLTEYDCFRKWKNEERNLLEEISGHVYIAVKQAELYSQAQQAIKIKNEFLASMSHEFRTPLNAIIGFTDMILSGVYGELPAKVTQYLGNVSKSGNHLLTLINDLLDLSKIEAKSMELNVETFDSKELIKNIVSSIKSLAIQKNITLDTCTDEVTVKADQKKITQILYNLLSNAIKFTKEGGKVKIKSSLNENKLVVMVEDTGIGIAKQDYDKVFAQFKQIDSSYTRKSEGTGLGLALSKCLVELHGGTIHFESEEGKGSRFWFVLPKAKAGQAEQQYLKTAGNKKF